MQILKILDFGTSFNVYTRKRRSFYKKLPVGIIMKQTKMQGPLKRQSTTELQTARDILAFYI